MEGVFSLFVFFRWSGKTTFGGGSQGRSGQSAIFSLQSAVFIKL